MPVTNTSGVAAILGPGPTPQGPGLEDFAKQLMAAKQAKKENALQDLDLATKLAMAGDVESAKKLGIPALGILHKHETGKEGTPSFFDTIAEQSKKEREQRDARASAEVDSLKAATEASRATTKREGAQTTGIEATNKYEAEIREHEKMLADPTIPNEERAYHAVAISVAKGLSPETTDMLTMNPVQFAKLKSDERIRAKITQDLANAAVADQLGWNAQQTKEYLDSGGKKVPVGTTSLQQQQIDIAKKNAETQLRGVKAQERGNEIAAAEQESRDLVNASTAWKTLVEADILESQGKGGTMAMKDILDGFQSIRTAQLAGEKPDPKVIKAVQDQLAARFGLTPVQTSSLFGLWKSNGYEFRGRPDSTANEGEELGAIEAPDPAASGMSLYGFGKELPNQAKSVVGAALTGIGEAIVKPMEGTEQFIRGVIGASPENQVIKRKK